jgi:hypothetical protein
MFGFLEELFPNSSKCAFGMARLSNDSLLAFSHQTMFVVFKALETVSIKLALVINSLCHILCEAF